MGKLFDKYGVIDDSFIKEQIAEIGKSVEKLLTTITDFNNVPPVEIRALGQCLQAEVAATVTEFLLQKQSYMRREEH